MTSYITGRRLKIKALDGKKLIFKRGTELARVQDFLFYGSHSVCIYRSQIAKDNFAINTDGRGLERFDLIQDIKKTLANRDDHWQERWDKVWSDDLCLTFQNPDHQDFWIWNDFFYDADIEELEHIKELIGG